jgi:hypothetical protein
MSQKGQFIVAAVIRGVTLFSSLPHKKTLARFSAVALLLATAFSSQSTSADEARGAGLPDACAHRHARAPNRNVGRMFDTSRKDTHWGKRKLKRDE